MPDRLNLRAFQGSNLLLREGDRLILRAGSDDTAFSNAFSDAFEGGVAPAAGRTTKNIRAFPLGVSHGISFRRPTTSGTHR